MYILVWSECFEKWHNYANPPKVVISRIVVDFDVLNRNPMASITSMTVIDRPHRRSGRDLRRFRRENLRKSVFIKRL
jgi:hypothetical protein